MVLPSVDMHAHIDVAIEPSELVALGAVVFAACRSLDEAEVALARSDDFTVWGTGCHPGLVGAQKAFSAARFRDQVLKTPYVAELGLDGKSRVPMDLQLRTLRSAFSVLADHPRITSLHSYEATEELIKVVAEYDLRGVVLHWWLGSIEMTLKAVELGCYFSINSSSARRSDLLRIIPLNRLLPETDHPFGDRHRKGERKPGAVEDIEKIIAKQHGLPLADTRYKMIQNLAEVVSSCGVGSSLSQPVKRLLLSG